MEEIVTDDKAIYGQLKQYLHENQPEDENRLRLYEDAMLPLAKLYQIDKAMEEALSTHVWLKSGGYLVIEPTEAMTVIDVNTGKYTGKKNKRDTILKIDVYKRQHPGSAKNKMKNAILMAMEFQNMLPIFENPMCTEGYEGFFHLDGIAGDVEETVMDYIIRDHDKQKFEEKKAYITRVADYLNQKYGQGTIELILKDSYHNMKEKIEPHMYLIDLAKEAMTDMGITPVVSPVRGGTDGARLSYMGLPCPNLCTGGHNYHGRFEYVCVQSMEKVVELLLKITEKFEGCCTQVGIF